jgi:flagellar protein FliO/FliZ
MPLKIITIKSLFYILLWALLNLAFASSAFGSEDSAAINSAKIEPKKSITNVGKQNISQQNISQQAEINPKESESVGTGNGAEPSFAQQNLNSQSNQRSSSLLERANNQLTPAQSLMPMLLGLVGILVVIFLLALLIKKVTGLNLVSQNIKVIESQSLGAKEKLVIVEIQNQQYLLGVTSQAINQICQLETKIEKPESKVSFDKMMQQFLNPLNAKNSEKIKSNNQSTDQAILKGGEQA